ncbi:MAG: peptidylprolyl isomerase [Anaerolineae bacterium]|nr:peptidylprolyl isomerase [Anaerolineae bacterium]
MAKASRKRKKSEQVERQTKKQIALGRKEARQNRVILISIVALATLIVAIIAFGVIRELVVEPNQPVATVNGDKIPADVYQDLVTYRRYNQYVQISNMQNALDEMSASPEENEFLISFYEQQISQMQSQLALLPQTAVDELIEDELIEEKAREEDISVTPQEVQDAIESDLRLALESPTQEPITGTEELPTPTPVPQEQVDELYDTILGNITLSRQSFEEIIRRSLLREKVQELLASQVVTTGLVAQPQIIQTETEEEARAALERIEGGEEFAIVAQEVSTDTVTAETGGDLGWVTTGQLSTRYGQELEDAIFSLPVGQIEVLQSGEMFYVVQVLDRDENGPLPTTILSQRRSEALSTWLEERKASPEVEIERLLTPDQIPEDPFTQSLAP